MTFVAIAAVALAAYVATWFLAARVAHARGDVLGGFPVWPGCSAAVGACAYLLAGARDGDAVLAAVTLGGVAAAAMTDVRHGLIYDRATIALLATQIIVAGSSGSLVHHAVAGAATCGAMALLFVATRGRGLGLGDVKLSAAIGFGLGFPAGPGAIGGAFIFGGLYGALLLLTRRASRTTALRFGPFLYAGTVTASMTSALRLFA